MTSVVNHHERQLATPPARVGVLIDALGGDEDRLWPADVWPAQRLNGPLAVGAAGGHGPIRYRVEGYEPGRWIRYRFTRPRGFHGFHEFAWWAHRTAPRSSATRSSCVPRARPGSPGRSSSGTSTTP